jgi:UDP-N-acetylmuramoyl-L-alanyl-D-glutamate--2,6-diaminopimelate ligase
VPDAAVLRPERLPSRSLRTLLDVVPGLTVARGAPDTAVSGITHDSRLVRPGDLYVAMPGAHTHGARHAAAAAAAGAVAVLTDRSGREDALATGLPVLVAEDARAIFGDAAACVYGTPSNHLLLLGVTGTNGKTTTSYLIEAGLRAAGHTTGLLGTIETRIGSQVLPSQRTTPEASDLQALLAVMVESGVTAAVMEVSSHALALRRVDATRFAVAVFTNLTQDHLDFHADIEDYFAAKARLFTPTFCDAAVIDVDTEFGRRLCGLASVPVTTVATRGAGDAAWCVDDLQSDVDGSSFVLRGPGATSLEVSVGLAGEFNVRNAALAVVALVVAGVDAHVAVDGVASCLNVPGRMQRVQAGQQFLALVDYAHTPDAVETLLATLRPLVPGRLILVLGAGGERDHLKRPLMGAAAARGSDIVIFTSDNPRSEDPQEIVTAMMAGLESFDSPDGSHADVRVELDRRAAIRLATTLAAPGDAVVVAGKGHERTQEIAGSTRPFDDVGELRAAITGHG